MKKVLKITLAIAISMLFSIGAVLPSFAESISGVTTNNMYVTWDEYPGAEKYVVEVFLGSEPIPEAGAEIKRISFTGVLPTNYSIQTVLGLLKSDFGYLEHPYGTYTAYITAMDADGNAISDRTRADVYEFGLDAMVTTTYHTVTVSPGDGTGEGYTLYVPKDGLRGMPDYQLLLRDCYFTPPEGKAFDCWSAGNPGETITVESDMTITPVWKDTGEPAAEPVQSEETSTEETSTEETVQSENTASIPETEPVIGIRDTSSTSPTTGYGEDSNRTTVLLIASSVLLSFAASLLIYVYLKKRAK